MLASFSRATRGAAPFLVLRGLHSPDARPPMRHLRVLLALFAITLSLPSGAWADTGWTTELRGARRSASAEEPVPTAVVRAAPVRPFFLFASSGAEFHGMAEPGARLARTLVCRTTPVDDRPADLSRSLLSTRSRARAAQRRFLQLGPSLALATRGVVGFHASPSPPLS